MSATSQVTCWDAESKSFLARSMAQREISITVTLRYPLAIKSLTNEDSPPPTSIIDADRSSPRCSTSQRGFEPGTEPAHFGGCFRAVDAFPVGLRVHFHYP